MIGQERFRPLTNAPAASFLNYIQMDVDPYKIRMEKHKEINKYDGDDFQLFDNPPSMWPRVIGIGILGLIAVLLVAYSTFEFGSIAMAFIGERLPSPFVLVFAALGAIAFLVQLR